MDWRELPLTAYHRKQLETELGISKPDEVVSIAQSMPTALGKIIPMELVDTIRANFPKAVSVVYDSSRFALGANFGSEPKGVHIDCSADFMNARSELVQKISLAHDDRERVHFEKQLSDLYSSPSR